MTREFKPTRLYIKRHTKTNKRYFGKTVNKDIEKYKGSGVDWELHLVENDVRHIVNDWVSHWFYDEAELKSFARAFSEIFDIVDSDDWANKIPETGDGGSGKGINKGMVPVKDKNGKVSRISTSDSRLKSGELVALTTDTVVVKDSTGNKFRISKDDPRYLSGELAPVHKGMVPVKDKNGKLLSVSRDDPRYIIGELVSRNKGTVNVFDKAGNKIKVSNTDPRYLSGELISIHKNKVLVQDKNGKRFKVANTDPRYLSGELTTFNNHRKENKL